MIENTDDDGGCQPVLLIDAVRSNDAFDINAGRAVACFGVIRCDTELQ